jgi:hypothetical protein
MANKIFKDLIKNDVSKLIKTSQAVSGIKQSVLKGTFREFGLDSLLTNYLPFGWDTGKGQIHDYKGNQSSEVDLIIYKKNILPPFLFSEKNGLFPIESCLYAVEIKTISNSEELKTTIDKFKKLQELIILPGSFGGINKVYFAYGSDLSEKSELERYKELDPNFYENPAIDVICVIGKGYWYHYKNFDNNTRKLKSSGWKFIKPTADNYEVICFIGGTINTISDMPRFGYYILDDKIAETVEEKFLDK